MDRAYFTKRVTNDTDLTLFERDSVMPGTVYDVFDGEFGEEEGSSEAFYHVFLSLRHPSDILLEGSVNDESGRELLRLPPSTAQMSLGHSLEGTLNISGEVFLHVRAQYTTDNGALQSPELTLPLTPVLSKGAHKLEHPTKRKEGEPVRRYGDQQKQAGMRWNRPRDTRYIVTVLNRDPADTRDIDYLCCWGQADGKHPYFGLPGKGSVIGPKNGRFLPDNKQLRASCILYPRESVYGGGILTASTNSVNLEYDGGRLTSLTGPDGKQYEITVGDITFSSAQSAPHIAQYEFLGAWQGKHLVYDEPEMSGTFFDYELNLWLPFQIPTNKEPVLYNVIVTSRNTKAPVSLVDHSVLPIKIMYGCVAQYSMVLTPDGEKPIRHIKIGDMVCTPDGVAKVRNCYYGYEKMMVRIVTCTGHSVLVTPDHPMMTDQGFLRARNINPFLRRLKLREGFAAISQISFVEYNDKVCSIELDGECLIINGFVTGDFAVQNQGI